MEAEIDENFTTQNNPGEMGRMVCTDSTLNDTALAPLPTLFPDVRGMEQRVFWEKHDHDQKQHINKYYTFHGMFPGDYRSSKKITFETLRYLGQDVTGDWEDRCDAVQPEAPLKRFWHERQEFRVAPIDGAHLVRLDFFKYSPFNFNETQCQDYYKMQVMCTWFQYCSGQPILRIATSPLTGNDWVLESVTHLESVANTTHPQKVLQMGVSVSLVIGIEDRSPLPGGRRRIPTFCASMDIPNAAWSPPMMGNVPCDGDGQIDFGPWNPRGMGTSCWSRSPKNSSYTRLIMSRPLSTSVHGSFIPMKASASFSDCAGVTCGLAIGGDGVVTFGCISSLPFVISEDGFGFVESSIGERFGGGDIGKAAANGSVGGGGGGGGGCCSGEGSWVGEM